MIDISIYFSPVEIESNKNEGTIGSLIKIYTEDNFPELKKNGIALLYVPEFRNDVKEFNNKFNDNFRKYFYDLYIGTSWELKIYDCGTILPGKEIEDTYFALTHVVAELVKENIIPIIIGGTQDLTYSVYKGYEKLEQMINICSVDHKLDLGNPDDDKISKDGYMSKILTHRPCYLFNHSNIGCQAPFVNENEIDLFEKLYFGLSNVLFSSRNAKQNKY